MGKFHTVHGVALQALPVERTVLQAMLVGAVPHILQRLFAISMLARFSIKQSHPSCPPLAQRPVNVYQGIVARIQVVYNFAAHGRSSLKYY